MSITRISQLDKIVKLLQNSSEGRVAASSIRSLRWHWDRKNAFVDRRALKRRSMAEAFQSAPASLPAGSISSLDERATWSLSTFDCGPDNEGLMGNYQCIGDVQTALRKLVNLLVGLERIQWDAGPSLLLIELLKEVPTRDELIGLSICSLSHLEDDLLLTFVHSNADARVRSIVARSVIKSIAHRRMETVELCDPDLFQEPRLVHYWLFLQRLHKSEEQRVGPFKPFADWRPTRALMLRDELDDFAKDEARHELDAKSVREVARRSAARLEEYSEWITTMPRIAESVAGAYNQLRHEETFPRSESVGLQHLQESSFLEEEEASTDGAFGMNALLIAEAAASEPTTVISTL